MTEILFSYQEHRSAVHYAVIGDPPKVEPNLEILRILLDAGGEVDLQDQVCMNNINASSFYTYYHYLRAVLTMDISHTGWIHSLTSCRQEWKCGYGKSTPE